MPLLGGCCFCFDLKDGSRIIGILNLIGAILNSLMFGILAVVFLFVGGGASVADTILQAQPTPPPFEEDDYQDVREQPKKLMELVMDSIAVVKVVVYILLALAILMIITSSMLIHGIRKNRRGLLLPFIVQESINILAVIAVAIGALVLFGTQMVISMSSLGLAVAALFHVYFLLVVISQYQALGLLRMHEEISMK